ncbi:MAG: methyltransferase domain-containing protein [Candidatus Thorarchaeota archaeon]
MKEKTGYLHEGTEEEVARLEFQADEDEEHLSAEFDILQINSGMKVLDAGCGTGAVTRRIARRVAPSKVVGVDLDEFFIEKAKEFAAKKEIENIQFEVGDVANLRFSDSVFDLSYSRLVLMHVQDPVKVVSELRRVTKSGGIVGVSDTDDDAMLIYPSIPISTELRSKSVEWMKTKGVNRYIGKELYDIFRLAGLKSIRIIPFPFIITKENPEDLEAYVSNLKQSYEQIKDLLIEQGIITSKESDEVYKELEEFLDHPGRFLMVCMFLGIGEVP